MPETPTVTEERKTFCRICEAYCGLVATVENETIVRLRPDPDHPLSLGSACPKGIAVLDIQNDADRVTTPLRRRADGTGFDRVTWDEAIRDIGARLRSILDAHGPHALGWYEGNPAYYSYSHFIWSKGFLDAVGSRNCFWAGSQDANNRFAASAILYGTGANTPFPDISRNRFLIIVGGNPLVSHGSVMSIPRIREHLHAIVGRGGRIVVIDPRRTETAKAFEHIPVNPDTDAYLLLAMHQVLFEEGLVDRAFVDRWTTGADELARLCRPYTPEAVAERTAVPAATIRALARDFAAADAAAAYGRTGSCLGRHATLVSFLLDTLNIVAGKMDTPGGAIFGRIPFPIDLLSDLIGLSSFGTKHSRIGGYPEIFGTLPAAVMAKEILTPGPGQIRAMMIGGGNPVTSVPNGNELERAFAELDLLVSMDIYITESNRHADYILPTTTFLERDDTPSLLSLSWYTTPFIQYARGVAAPRGEAREEWQILEAIGREIGIVPSPIAPLRALGRLGIRISPQRLLDIAFRLGPEGDLFGLRRGGLSLGKLLHDHPSGKVLRRFQPTGRMKKVIRHKTGRIPLAQALMVAEIERLAATPAPEPDFPLRMIGMRELRSHNTWMHNAEPLMRGGRTHAFRIHPDDAARFGIRDGEEATVTSRTATVTTTAKVTDDMIPGTIAMPHGWGHKGGWHRAVAAGGANSNLLATSEPEELEQVVGHSVLNGIPVRVAPVVPVADPGAAAGDEVTACATDTAGV